MILAAAVVLWLAGLLAVTWTPRLAPEARRSAQLDLIALGALGVLTAGFFWQILFTYSAWMPAGGGDLAGFLYPTYHFAQEWITRGVLPLWNPHIFGGTPFIGDIQTAVLYPPNLLTYFLANPITYRDLEYLSVLHFYIAAAGMYALLRFGPITRLGFQVSGLSRAAALMGAIVFAFSDLFIIHFGNLNLIATAAWLPLVFLFFARAVEPPAEADAPTHFERKRVRFAILCGITLALSFFAGHIQPYLFILLVLVIYAVYMGWLYRHQRKPILLMLVLAFAVGIGLSAVTLLPALELARLSVRSAFTYAEAAQFSLPPLELVGLVVPGFFGRGPAAAWGPWQRVEVGYIGIFPLALAALALVMARNRRTLFYAVLALVGLLLALGGYAILHGWLFQFVPGFGQLRAPARFVFVMDFGLAVLAAIGMDALTASFNAARRDSLKRIVRVGAWVVLVVALVSGALALGIVILGQGQDPTLYQRIAAAANGIAFFVLLLVLAFALLFLLARDYIPSRWWAALALALVILDLFSLGAYVDVGTSDPTLGYQRADVVDFLKSQTGLARIDSRTDVEGLWRPDTGLLYRLQDVYGDNPLVLADFSQYWEGLGGRDSNAYNLLNVKYVLALRDTPMPPNFAPAFEGGGGIKVWENRTLVPRAWLVHSTRVVDSPQDAEREVNNPAFDPRTTALLSGDGARPLDLPTSADDVVSVTGYAPNEIVIRTGSKADGYLIVSEVFAPGWRAEVDGQPSQVVRANGIFRGVLLPAGEHTVRLVYQPDSFRLGALISICTLALSIALWIWAGREPKKQRPSSV